MKSKILIFVLSICMVLTGCSKESNKGISKLTKLGENETLYIGNTPYKSYKTSVSEEYYYDKIVKSKNTLYRSTSSYSSSCSTDRNYYNGYYYCWNVNETETQEYVGEKTTENIVEYEYLVYSQNESILLKKTSTTKVNFDFDSKWVVYYPEIEYELNGYFTSFDSLLSLAPEIAALINHSTKREIYIDATVPASITTTKETFNSYYYIETN